MNKLLRSTQRKKTSRRRSGRGLRLQQTVVVTGGDAVVRRRTEGGGAGPSIAAVSVLGTVCGMCGLTLQGFGTYVERHGHEDLAKVSFTSLGLIAMGVYSHALYMLAEEERRRGP